MLPAVDVMLRLGDVSVDAKLPAVIELFADRVMELVPLTPAANASPPVVEVKDKLVAVSAAPAAELIDPFDNTLKAAPAPDAAVKFVAAPVFRRKTFCAAPVAFATRLDALTTRRLLPARSPTLPAVDERLTDVEVSGALKLPLRMLF